MPPTPRKRLWAVLPAALALTLAACGGTGTGAGAGAGDTPASGAAPADLTKALDTPVTLTFWTWVPNLDKTVALFEQRYPNVKVNVVNAGQSADEYTKLQTAMKAGTGGPDVAQVEFFALPQFALAKQLVKLDDYGVASLRPKYTASAWSQVNFAGGVYGFPQDTGPMVMFYRKDILDRLGLQPPKTWQNFADAAEKIHADDPRNFISSIDPGDAGGVDSLLWQAGSRPFQTVTPTQASVNLKDAGAAAWSALWSDLLRRKLVDPVPGWTNEWWQGMGSGRYAMWITGAWAPGSMSTTIPKTAGKWRVAPMPQWKAGDQVTAENGGSADVVLTTSKNKTAAVAFAQWLNSDPVAVKSLSDNGLFPATTGLLADPAFLDAPNSLFGDQRPNKIFAESSARVGTGWQYLPFQVYANSVFKDTAGQPISTGSDLAAGLTAWQRRIVEYGEQQGFQVTSG
ncbi:ABC transporter substrate-binding protein [Sphaerisporangium corydalis]|uniref:ABC transporter substrate-binding protein n=1 Tax=Sphaerisporangium corydalis TaxID=1441875 RepID=A0ABV9ETK2_9ACTN|nr:sugar ABC transporter substrate-binding protein [Sphaerisporangium corydalis]